MTAPTVQPDRQSGGEECLVRLNSDSLHDLMGPVNQMCTITDLILKKHGASLDRDAQVLFGFLQKAADQMHNLLGGLRAYVRVAGAQTSHLQCDGNALLAGAVASIQPSIAESGAVVTHDPLPEVCCDPSQMIYTLAALIENSIQFRGEARPEIHMSAVAEGNDWVFSVRDNGAGIDPQFAERIFGVFKRVHNEANAGPGVGLAIARHVVEQHGGRIWVDSRPGLGATFFFTLPRDAPYP